MNELINYDIFGRNEVFCKVTGNDKVKDKNFEKVIKSQHDHLTQIKSKTKQSEETTSRKTFYRNKL